MEEVQEIKPRKRLKKIQSEEYNQYSPDQVHRKKKKRTGVDEIDKIETPVVENEQQKPKKKRRKKKKVSKETVGPIGLEAEVVGLNEDIVETSEQTPPIANATLGQTTMKSEPINKIFVERKNGFQTTTKLKLEKKERMQMMELQQDYEEQSTENTMDLAVSTQNGIHIFSTFCIGLLAGIGLWHIIIAFVMTRDLPYNVFLKGYSRIANPSQSLYYLLFAICTVSICDRYDLGRPTKMCLLNYKSGVLAILIYLSGLIVSLVMAAVEDKMTAWSNNKDIFINNSNLKQNIDYWLKLNASRAVLAIIGWIIMCFQTETNRLSKNLIISNEEIMADMDYGNSANANVNVNHNNTIQSNNIQNVNADRTHRSDLGFTNRAFSSMA